MGLTNTSLSPTTRTRSRRLGDGVSLRTVCSTVRSLFGLSFTLSRTSKSLSDSIAAPTSNSNPSTLALPLVALCCSTLEVSKTEGDKTPTPFVSSAMTRWKSSSSHHTTRYRCLSIVCHESWCLGGSRLIRQHQVLETTLLRFSTFAKV